MSVSTLRQITKKISSPDIKKHPANSEQTLFYDTFTVLEFNDNLQGLNLTSGVLETSSIHSPYSKIKITLLQKTSTVDKYRKVKPNTTKTIILNHNLGPEEIRTFCQAILSNDTAAFQNGKRYSSNKPHNQYKLDADGKAHSTEFSVKYQETQMLPWEIEINQKRGDLTSTKIGAKYLTGASKVDSAVIKLSKFEMYEMARTLIDYLNAYEALFYKTMLEERMKVERVTIAHSKVFKELKRIPSAEELIKEGKLFFDKEYVEKVVTLYKLNEEVLK